ncbi:MAG: hypothetical protein M3O32_05065 [Actinomycetota bacterium]|nr:hypothetical protein [Actinomycetota bacterium]
MKLTDEVAARIEAIRTGAEGTYGAIRARTELTAAAKAVLLAKAYLKGSTDMKALQAQAEAEYEARCQELTIAAFGVNDLGYSTVDRAALSMNLRDAQRRVDEIVAGPNPRRSAEIAYARAESTNDELMCRALAETAWNRPDLLWQDEILMPFVKDRPLADTALGELRDLLTPGGTPDFFAWVFLKPTELSQYNDFRILSIAGGDTSGYTWSDGVALTGFSAQ